MMIFKKAIPRRTFLRGAGATLALPLLEGMVPAFAAAPNPALRLAVVYAPNGMMMDKWTPAAEGAAFDLPPILEPLAAFQDRFLVLSGLSQREAYARPSDVDKDFAPHERAGAGFLTGTHANRRGPLAPSIDQVAAQELGKQTQLASLELGLHNTDLVGQCEKGWSCAVLRTLSWRSPTTPLPTESRPRAVFERLFGDSSSTEPAERVARARKDQSLLDAVTEAAHRLLTRVGPSDRVKVGEYLDAIRDVERRIQLAEEQSSRDLPVLTRPSGVPESFDEHAKLMFDLNLLAFQADLTRVTTFMMGREQSDRSFREIGISDAHHALTHHGGNPALIAKVIQINIFHSELFAYFLERMRATPDGDGSLLDHSMIMYGSGIGEGNGHNFTNLPILLAGEGGGQIKPGRHVRYAAEDTPISNLYLTLLGNLGLSLETFGDSNGRLELPA